MALLEPKKYLEMDGKHLILAKDDRVAITTLNRPERLDSPGVEINKPKIRRILCR